ncbi:hypothetical protein VNO78_19921 [Psophocarpus tetragonolobus]|uniref:Uncharacterized protein n=1 Tax=Psophocarpus tetragonolobus TaxID=3891 RepID=A0AAN9SAC2_PSOTE
MVIGCARVEFVQFYLAEYILCLCLVGVRSLGYKNNIFPMSESVTFDKTKVSGIFHSSISFSHPSLFTSRLGVCHIELRRSNLSGNYTLLLSSAAIATQAVSFALVDASNVLVK